ncbi:hypothetical protein ACEQ8H_005819 [Pleosporales sp. CAS-2024a]
MAKAATYENDPSKMYSADVVAAVLMASGTTSLSMKQYEMMSALDGTRTANSFQHAFRAVLAKSKELKARVDGGEVFHPVQPISKRGTGTATSSPATPRKRKVSSDDEETPAKKKASPKKKVIKEEGNNDLRGIVGTLPLDMDDFIRAEARDEM